MFNVFKILYFMFFHVYLSKSDYSKCDQLGPNLYTKFFLGVDITKLNLFPDYKNIESYNGFKDIPIFDLKCTQKKKFQLTNSLNNEKIDFYLPDHAKISLYNSNEELKKNSRIFEKDEKEYQQNLLKNLELDSFDNEEKEILNKLNYETDKVEDLLLGSFKLNNYYYEIRSSRIFNKRIPLETKISTDIYKIDFDVSKLSFSDAFMNQINILSDNYEESLSSYEELIFSFGTHYFQSFHAGGIAKIKLEKLKDQNIDNLNEDQFTNYDPFNITMEKLNFKKYKNFGYNETIFQTDKCLYKKEVFLYGGNILNDKFSIDKWVKTTQIDPWLIKGQLFPLSRLIKHPNKKRNFLRAMMAYIDKAEIINLQQSLDDLKTLNFDEQQFKKLKEKTEILNRQRIVNHKELLVLSKKISVEIDKQIKIFYSNNLTKYQDNLLTVSLKNYLETNNSYKKSMSYILTLSILILNLVFLKLYCII